MNKMRDFKQKVHISVFSRISQTNSKHVWTCYSCRNLNRKKNSLDKSLSEELKMGKVKLKIKIEWKGNNMTKWFYIERKFTKAHSNKIRGKTFALGVILETIWRLICQVIFNSTWFFFIWKKILARKL